MIRWFLRGTPVSTLFWLLVLLLGGYAFHSLPQQEDPEFPNWAAVVLVSFPGSSAEQVEELVTRVVENHILEVEQVLEVQSISRPGGCQITVKLRESVVDTAPVWEMVRQRLIDAEGELPEGAHRPWLNESVTSVKSVVLAVCREPGVPRSEHTRLTREILSRLRSLKHTGKAETWGELAEAVNVEFQPAKIAQFGQTPRTIAETLRQENTLLPQGRLKDSLRDIRIRTTSLMQNEEQLRELVLGDSGHSSGIRLGDVADIRLSPKEPPLQEMRFLGQDAVGIQLQMKHGSKAIEFGQSILKEVAAINETLPFGVTLQIVSFQPEWVEARIQDFAMNLLQAVAIVIVTMWALLGFSQSIVISLLIPFSFCITGIGMALLHMELHMISIASMIIALGMMVDNGIVVTEAVGLSMRRGNSPFNAALESSRSLRLPLFISTLTTILAFAPVALAESAVGIFCNSLPWVVGMVLMASLFVGLTLNARLAMKINPLEQGFLAPWLLRLESLYLKYLPLAISRPQVTILSIGVLVILPLGLIRYVGEVFFPPKDRPEFTVQLWLEEGSSFSTTRAEAIHLEQYLLRHYRHAIRSLAVYTGKRGPKFAHGVPGDSGSQNYAQLYVRTNLQEQQPFLMRAISEWCHQNQPLLQAVVLPLESGPEVGAPIQLEVRSQDPHTLTRTARDLRNLLQSKAGVTMVRDNWGLMEAQIRLETDQSALRKAGASSQTLAQLSLGFFSGFPVSVLRTDSEEIPILFRAKTAGGTSLSDLESVMIPARDGQIPLLQVARAQLEFEQSRIIRKNGDRAILVEAFTETQMRAHQILNEIRTQLPEGVEILGVQKKSAEARDSLIRQIPAPFSLMILLLAWQFDSLRLLVLVLLPIPLGLCGVILSLYLSGYAFGFMAFLGIVSLSGIVINNSILLLEAAERESNAGNSSISAAITAGKERMRPIVLTTATTVLGLIPLWHSGHFWGPMAAAIMGGLLYSTVMTLILIPCVYAWIKLDGKSPFTLAD